MASFTLIDATVTINSVDLSDFATSVTLSIEADEQEDTAFGDTYRSRIGGLKDYTLDIGWNQTFAASEVDATLFPLIGTVVTWAVKPTSDAVSATNPEYSGSVLITEYTPLDGSVGDVATLSTSWPGALGTGIVRDVTP